ncbi:MAG TPA: Hpt domain-containing protein, partial [Hyphomonadaceae bacterium]|nr:Hpt domain-containing protein [Hyphomonadaceae bacterium]
MGNTSAEASRFELRKRYIRQLEERMRLLQPMAGRLATETMTLSDFELLEREAHRLSGSGAVYGYPIISDTAAALELGLRNGVRDATEIAALLAPLLKASLQVVGGGGQFAGGRGAVVVGEDRHDRVADAVGAADQRGLSGGPPDAAPTAGLGGGAHPVRGAGCMVVGAPAAQAAGALGR